MNPSSETWKPFFLAHANVDCDLFGIQTSHKFSSDELKKLNDKILAESQKNSRLKSEIETHSKYFQSLKNSTSLLKDSKISLLAEKNDLLKQLELQRIKNCEDKKQYDAILSKYRTMWQQFLSKYQELPLARKKKVIEIEKKNLEIDIDTKNREFHVLKENLKKFIDINDRRFQLKFIEFAQVWIDRKKEFLRNEQLRKREKELLQAVNNLKQAKVAPIRAPEMKVSQLPDLPIDFVNRDLSSTENISFLKVQKLQEELARQWTLESHMSKFNKNNKTRMDTSDFSGRNDLNQSKTRQEQFKCVEPENVDESQSKHSEPSKIPVLNLSDFKQTVEKDLNVKNSIAENSKILDPLNSILKSSKPQKIMSPKSSRIPVYSSPAPSEPKLNTVESKTSAPVPSTPVKNRKETFSNLTGMTSTMNPSMTPKSKNLHTPQSKSLSAQKNFNSPYKINSSKKRLALQNNPYRKTTSDSSPEKMSKKDPVCKEKTAGSNYKPSKMTSESSRKIACVPDKNILPNETIVKPNTCENKELCAKTEFRIIEPCIPQNDDAMETTKQDAKTAEDKNSKNCFNETYTIEDLDLNETRASKKPTINSTEVLQKDTSEKNMPPVVTTEKKADKVKEMDVDSPIIYLDAQSHLNTATCSSSGDKNVNTGLITPMQDNSTKSKYFTDTDKNKENAPPQETINKVPDPEYSFEESFSSAKMPEQMISMNDDFNIEHYLASPPYMRSPVAVSPTKDFAEGGFDLFMKGFGNQRTSSPQNNQKDKAPESSPSKPASGFQMNFSSKPKKSSNFRFDLF